MMPPNVLYALWRAPVTTRTIAAAMTEVENLILDRMRSAIDALRDDMREVKTRLGILENQYASMCRPALTTRAYRATARLGGGMIRW